MKRLLREPLVHFLLLGGLLFAAYARWGGGTKSGDTANQIVVSVAQEKQMVAAFKRVWQRPPTRDELAGLVNDFVRDEVYVREALKLGLDQDDTVIRQRLRQKMEFLGDDTFKPPTPTDAELEKFLKDNAAWFSQDAEYTFRHVFFDTIRRGDAAKADALAALADLRAPGNEVDPNSLGDRFGMGQEFQSATATSVARMFGDDFVKQLRSLKPGSWLGPIASTSGLHLVKLESVKEGRLPALAEVRDAVKSEWLDRKRTEANEAFYQSLRKKYAVEVEPLKTNVLTAEVGGPTP